MVLDTDKKRTIIRAVSVLALSSRFDGLYKLCKVTKVDNQFQYSLCRVVLMVSVCGRPILRKRGFSTRSVESF